MQHEGDDCTVGCRLQHQPSSCIKVRVGVDVNKAREACTACRALEEILFPGMMMMDRAVRVALLYLSVSSYCCCCVNACCVLNGCRLALVASKRVELGMRVSERRRRRRREEEEDYELPGLEWMEAEEKGRANGRTQERREKRNCKTAGTGHRGKHSLPEKRREEKREKDSYALQVVQVEHRSTREKNKRQGTQRVHTHTLSLFALHSLQTHSFNSRKNEQQQNSSSQSPPKSC